MITSPTRTSKGRRGFTIIEVLVAATMAIVFGYIVISSLTSITGMSTDVYKQATTEANARTVTDLLARAAKNAVPLYDCPSATKLSDCGDLVIRKPAFDRTSPTEAWFFAYAERSADGSATVTAEATPNLVHIVARHRADSTTPEADDPNADFNWEVCVETYAQPGSAFDVWRNMSTLTTPTVVCAGPIGKPLAGVKTFRFLDSAGNSCEQTVASAVIDCRSDIRHVEVNLALSYRTRSGERYVKPFQSFIAVTAAGLGG